MCVCIYKAVSTSGKRNAFLVKLLRPLEAAAVGGAGSSLHTRSVLLHTRHISLYKWTLETHSSASPLFIC